MKAPNNADLSHLIDTQSDIGFQYIIFTDANTSFFEAQESDWRL